MRGFKPEDIAPAAALVENFAVFDRWFSGMPGCASYHLPFICAYFAVQSDPA